MLQTLKKTLVLLILVTGLLSITNNVFSESEPDITKLKIVIIRHGEKPPLGDNLNCKGLNRSMQLPAVIKAKFDVPDYVYVPALNQGKQTLHARMFQTITPLVAKYNLKINSAHELDDYLAIYKDLTKKTGTVLLVWEHKAIAPLVRTFGLKVSKWADDDYDSIWIITFPKGVPTLSLSKEGLNPSDDCNF